MSTTRQLQELQGAVKRHTPADGEPTRVWVAQVSSVNADGTVDIMPVYGRAGKANVPTADGYPAKKGDQVLCVNVNGDRQTPAVIGPLTRAAGPPAVTGSRSSGAALLSLLTALADAHIIVDNTTA